MTHEIAANKLDSLLKIMQDLRAPHGCPWDAAQTPESLAPYIIEEACELVDAIEGGSPELVLDELGDLLLQVVFQAQIYAERGSFDFHDVAAAISAKLVRRHPHVFAQDGLRREAAELDRQWETIKRTERTHNKSCLADHLPGTLPALQRAQKLITRLERSGRRAELTGGDAELRQLAETETDLAAIGEETVGRALLRIARLAHEAGVDAEAALRKAVRVAVGELDHPPL